MRGQCCDIYPRYDNQTQSSHESLHGSCTILQHVKMPMKFRICQPEKIYSALKLFTPLIEMNKKTKFCCEKYQTVFKLKK